MGRSVLSPPVANIPDFDPKLLSDLAGRLAAVTPMVHYRTLKLLGITFPRFAPFGATVLVHNSLVSDPTNRVQFFGGRALLRRWLFLRQVRHARGNFVRNHTVRTSFLLGNAKCTFAVPF